MKKTMTILAAFGLLLTILSSALAFGYFAAGSVPYTLMIVAALLFGGVFTACASRLLGTAK